MLTRSQLNAALDRMEACLADTRRTIIAVARNLENRAEAGTIQRRPKAR